MRKASWYRKWDRPIGEREGWGRGGGWKLPYSNPGVAKGRVGYRRCTACSRRVLDTAACGPLDLEGICDECHAELHENFSVTTCRYLFVTVD